MIFILVAALMVAVAAACIAVPLWRGHAVARISMTEAGKSVYQRQLAELKRDLDNGLLAETDYQSAVRDIELEQRASEAKATESAWRTSRRGRAVALASVLLLVVTTVLFYWRMGNWRVGVEGTNAASRVAIQQMVQKLADRLHSTDQDDLQGWLMLGHAYVIMERYQDAVDAFEHARKLAGDGNAGVLAAYAEAVTLADPDQFAQRAAPLFEKVLKLDPTNVKALWYGGLAASQEGNNALAVKRWQTLLQQNLPENYAEFVAQYIRRAGGTVPATASAKANTVIHVHVALNPALLHSVQPDETVFVFARPEGEQGGPPLAVKRLQVRDLPMDVTLSDSDAMIAGRNLSKFSTIQLVARISRDGSPKAKPGEPTGMALWERSKDSRSVKLSIDPAG